MDTRRRRLLAALPAWPLGLAATAAPAQPPATWLLATGYRAESFHTQNLQQFGADVEQASGGALLIDLRPGGSLMKLRDIFPGVAGGQVAAGEAIMSAIAPEVPEAGADSVPFIVGSYEDARRLWKVQRPAVERRFQEKGVHLLYAVPWPPQGLYSVSPVASTADLKTGRMRTFDATTARIAELVGARPVDIAMVDLPARLVAGDIDSMVTSAVTGIETRAWSRMRYYYSVNAFFPKNAVFVNARAYAALDARTRAAVDTAAQAAEERGWALSRSQQAAADTELKARGMSVERPSRQLEEEIRRLGERFAREWVHAAGKAATDILVPYYFN